MAAIVETYLSNVVVTVPVSGNVYDFSSKSTLRLKSKRDIAYFMGSDKFEIMVNGKILKRDYHVDDVVSLEEEIGQAESSRSIIENQSSVLEKTRKDLQEEDDVLFLSDEDEDEDEDEDDEDEEEVLASTTSPEEKVDKNKSNVAKVLSEKLNKNLSKKTS